MSKKHYSHRSFWSKLRRAATKAGRQVLEAALTAYYCMRDEDTPAWAKGVLMSALGYFIWPLDAIPDALPGGYTDDVGVLLGALATVAAHVKREHVRAARRFLRERLGIGRAAA